MGKNLTQTNSPKLKTVCPIRRKHTELSPKTELESHKADRASLRALYGCGLCAHLLGLVQRIRTMAPGRSTLLRNGSMASRLGSSTGESAMAGTRIALKSRGGEAHRRTAQQNKKRKNWRVRRREVGDDEDIYATREPSSMQAGSRTQWCLVVDPAGG